jgi:hypothetical protein
MTVNARGGRKVILVCAQPSTNQEAKAMWIARQVGQAHNYRLFGYAKHFAKCPVNVVDVFEHVQRYNKIKLAITKRKRPFEINDTILCALAICGKVTQPIGGQVPRERSVAPPKVDELPGMAIK